MAEEQVVSALSIQAAALLTPGMMDTNVQAPLSPPFVILALRNARAIVKNR